MTKDDFVVEKSIDNYSSSVWHEYRLRDYKKTSVLDPFLWNPPEVIYSKKQ